MKHLVAAFSILWFCCQTVSAQDAGFNWVKHLTGSGSPTIEEIATDASGNIYVLGYFTGEVDFDPSASQKLITASGGEDIFFAKYNASGDLIWIRQLATAANERATGLKIDDSNNAYICGYFEGTINLNPVPPEFFTITSSGGTDGFLAKYNSSGTFQWSQRIGDTADDRAVELDIEVNGGVYLTGYYQGTVDFDPGAGTNNLTSAGMQDIFIVKYNTSGTYLFATSVGGTSLDIPYDIALNCCGGYMYLTGQFYATTDFNPGSGTNSLTSAGGSDAFVAKYLATNGGYQWAFAIGSTADEIGRHIEFHDAGANTGSVYVAGTYRASVDLDPGTGTATATYAGGSFEDIFLAKYNAAGTFEWGNGIGSTNQDMPTGLSLVGSSHLFLAGYFRGTVDVDPGSGITNLTSSPLVNPNAFLVYYSDLGGVNWAKNIPSVLWSSGHALGTSGSADLIAYLGGKFYGSTDFDTGAGVYNLNTDSGPDEGFLARYTDIDLEPAQPTNLLASSTTSQVTLNFTGSGASGYLVLRRTGAASTVVPVDGTTYTAGSTLGDAQVRYSGASTSFTDTGLSPGTQYYYSVFAYNGGSTATNYNTTPLTASPYTLLPAPVANAATAILKTGFTANWSEVTGATEYRLDVSTNNFSTFVGGYNNLAVPTTSKAVTGLSTGVVYQYRVRAVNPGGPSDNSSTVSVTTLGAPVISEATSISQTSFVANWQAAPVVDYRLDVSTNNFVTNLPGYDNLTVTVNSEFVTGLTPGSVYQYRVRSSSGADISDNSSTATVLLRPATPTASSATGVTSTFFTASWSAAAGATVYRVDVSSDGFSSRLTGYDNLAVVGTALMVTGLSPSTTYQYRVRAENSSGESPNSSTITVLTVPAAPTALPASNVTGSSFVANWSSSTGAVDYRLDVSVDDFASLLVGFDNLTVSGTSQLVSGLPPAVSYQYRVRAANATGPSVNSNKVVVIASQATNIVFSGITPTSITVGYTNGAASSRLLVARAGSAVDAFPQDGTTYSENSTFGSGSQLGIGNFVVAKGSGPVTVTGLNPETTYHFRLFEFAGVPGSESYNVSPALGNPASRSTLAIEPTGQPGLSIGSIERTAFQVTVTAAAGSPMGYLVIRSNTSAPPTGVPEDGTVYSVSQDFGNGTVVYVGTASTFSQTGLASNSIYPLLAYSYNGSGSSRNYLTTSPPAASALTYPDAPIARNASNNTSTFFDANWDAPSGTGALTYQVDVSDNAFATILLSPTSSSTSVRITGLTAAKDYQYRVRAVNATGPSTNSNVVTARTADPPVSNPLAISTPATKTAVPADFLESTQTVTVTGGVKPITVVLKHRKVSAVDYSSLPAIEGAVDNTYIVTITSAMLDELGVEFFYEATDDAGIVAVSNGNSFLYRDLTSTATVIPFSPSFDGTMGTYQMFSIPYILDDKTVATVFAAQGPPDKTRWRLLRYQGGKYIEYPDNITNLDIGKGYWFNTTAKTDIPVGLGSPVQASQSSPFTLPLEKGWNQIGNPFPFSIDWLTVRNLPANASVGINSLWTYANGSYVNTTGFKPWMGGFVFSDNGGTLTIPVTSRCSGCRVATEPILADLDAPNWQVPITLSLNGTGQVAAVGMHPDARMTKDSFDEIVVPRFNNYIEFYTRHPEFFAPQFAVDMVPPSDEASWMFTASSNYPDGRAVLRWDPLPLQQSSAALALLDIAEGMLVDMKAVSEYAFTFADKKQFKVIYSRDGEVKPGLTMLGQSYPNPFQSGVSIPIMLKAPQSRLQIHVYDLWGRRVRTLTRDAVQEGTVVFTWDGRTDDGRETDAGLYLYQLVGDTGVMGSAKRMIKQ